MQMNRLGHTTLTLIPDQFLGLALTFLLVLGGFFLILGARKTAIALIVMAIATPFLGAFFQAVFNDLETLLPPLVMKILSWAVLIVVGLSIVSGVIVLLFGKRSWEEAKAQLIADSIKTIARMVFSIPALIIWCILGIYLWLM